MAKSGERQLPPEETTVWRGVFSDVNPMLIPKGGTQSQVNITNLTPGRLETRFGVRDVQFEN